MELAEALAAWDAAYAALLRSDPTIRTATVDDVEMVEARPMQAMIRSLANAGQNLAEATR